MIVKLNINAIKKVWNKISCHKLKFKKHISLVFIESLDGFELIMEDYVIAAVVDSAERNYQERIQLERLRDQSNPFQMAEEKFIKIFRLPRSGALYLVDHLRNPRLDEGFIPKHLKILAALNLFAQGSYQTAVGQDNILGLSQPSVSRCLTLTAEEILTTLSPQYLRFPVTPEEKVAAKRDFLDLYNMPNTLGAVDGTHVSIAKPPLNHPTAPGNLFYNRKGYYSINCQIVCSARGKIIGLNPNFPGSTHDFAIWRASKIQTVLRNEFIHGERSQWLLGDKGYPLQPWLMTPIMVPTTEAEASYNEFHTRARNVVEMCNGRLKNKFRCLHRHRCLHYQPEKAAKIILACCTLYNMFLATSDDEEDNNINVTEDSEQSAIVEDTSTDFLAEAREIRQSLVNFFN